MKKKIINLLSLEDLYNFYATQNKSCNFSSKDSGYQLSVQVPAKFEKIDEDKSDGLTLFCDVKIMHSGRNRNKSNVTDDALINASKQLAYKPILANFVEYTDNETNETLKDFTSHDIEKDKDGNTIYIEKQVGCFTSDEPYFEVEKETGHNFLYGKCAIPIEYTDSASIIRRKGGTKVSVELGVNACEFDANKKELLLTDISIMGLTLLGKNPDTLEDIGEGMKNARLDIADFSAENNSAVAHINEQPQIFNKLIDTLENLNKTISNFNDKNSTKGGNLLKFEELLMKYPVTKEDIDFNYEGLSDEELEAKFKEKFDDENSDASDVDSTSETTDDDSESNTEETDQNSDSQDSTTDDPDKSSEEKPSDNNADDNTESDTASTSSDEKKKKKYSIDIDGEVKSFEIALDDKIYALSNLVNTQYGESDNCWYSVKVYEKYLVMSDYWTGIAYKQTYSQNGDNFSLTGDRVEVFATYLTQEELNELEEMRSNYAALVEYKNNAEFSKLHSQREEILNAEKYSVLKDTDEFKALIENMDKYNLVDLEKEAKVIFADYITSHAEAFSAKNPEKETKKKFNGGMRFGVDSEGTTVDNEKSPYGDYFKSLKK